MEHISLVSVALLQTPFDCLDDCIPSNAWRIVLAHTCHVADAILAEVFTKSLDLFGWGRFIQAVDGLDKLVHFLRRIHNG